MFLSSRAPLLVKGSFMQSTDKKVKIRKNTWFNPRNRVVYQSTWFRCTKKPSVMLRETNHITREFFLLVFHSLRQLEMSSPN